MRPIQEGIQLHLEHKRKCQRERLIAETGFGNELSCGGRSSRRAARHGMDIARGNATCFGW